MGEVAIENGASIPKCCRQNLINITNIPRHHLIFLPRLSKDAAVLQRKLRHFHPYRNDEALQQNLQRCQYSVSDKSLTTLAKIPQIQLCHLPDDVRELTS